LKQKEVLSVNYFPLGKGRGKKRGKEEHLLSSRGGRGREWKRGGNVLRQRETARGGREKMGVQVPSRGMT